MRDYSRLDQFLNRIGGDVYPEPSAEPHKSIIRAVIAILFDAGVLRAGMRVLDVGCGQGFALGEFRDRGLDAVGITLGKDAEVCREQGFAVHEMDQNFMTFPDNEFDVLWCRHVLEHSVAPLFTLSEYWRVLKSGGLAYVEVPAPDTASQHQTNPNHYSVLPASSWRHLFVKSGFTVEEAKDLNLPLTIGPDVYWSYQLRKP
jgi:SAM-dependent methyltransferase